MVARTYQVAIALVLCATSAAHAEENAGGGKAFEGELGLAVVYSTADLVSVGGNVGFSFGKPILDVFYVEPVLHAELGLFNAGRLAGMLRCNFVASPGIVWSVGFGAGTGWKTLTDDNGNETKLSRDFREIEVALKKGGKRRFFVGLAIAFDTDEMGVESKSVMLQTTLLRAGP
ncbi:MAG TPA: hypothetical protein VFV99_03115 [Kofleriaceae bacterium]|nr:hypothetical protein [Kofleriaceae bacterium]